MFIIIDIYSKNYNSLISFFETFLNKNVCNKLKLIILKSSLQKRKKKTKFTVLKSPHVNKTAQEQFEYRIYKKQLKCFAFQSVLFLMFLKQVKFYLFSDIKIKVNIVNNYNNSRKKLQNKFNVDNYHLNLSKSNFITYLTVFGMYGEVALKLKLFR